MQWIESIETYTYGTSKDLVNDKDKIKRNNIIKRYKKWLVWCYKRRNKKKDPNWPHIPDGPYRLLIIGGSGSG